MKEKILVLSHNLIVRLIFLCLLIEIIIEMLSHRSVFGGIKFIFISPQYFLLNCLIILSSYLICMMFRRRAFLISIVTSIWLCGGIINCIVLDFRATPFSASDILMVKSTIRIIDKYFNTPQICLLIVCVVLFLTTLVYLWFKLPVIDKVTNHLAYGVSALLIVCIFIFVSNYSSQARGVTTAFSNLNSAYNSYGFVYCFANSAVNTGISKPFNYSEDQIETIKKKIDKASKVEDNSKIFPNIIYVQLESFMDLDYVDGLTLSDNYLTNYRELRDKYTSGLLTVPVIGGGTANTEFEVLTAMNISCFGAGEYPYKTILKNTACDSMAYDMKTLGYISHAIHDNSATFYDRDVVYANLGFDTFTSIEYMYNVEYNAKGWAKDKVLIENVKNALQSTSGRDFIYTVSVQGHGKYPSQVLEDNDGIVSDTVSLKMENGTDIEVNRLDYYIEETNEMDAFIGDLIDMVNEYDEPTVIVFFGDHQPNLDFTEDDLNGINRYQTEYIIWDNINLKKSDENLNAYQLSAKVDSLSGLEGGMMTKYHQYRKGKAGYQENMELLQYDMLYGKHYLYGENSPYVPTILEMGIKDIYIRGIENNFKGTFIHGEGFNEFSRLLVNGKQVDSTYIDNHTIAYEDDALHMYDELSVFQVGEDGKTLSISSVYIYE